MSPLIIDLLNLIMHITVATAASFVTLFRLDRSRGASSYPIALREWAVSFFTGRPLSDSSLRRVRWAMILCTALSFWTYVFSYTFVPSFAVYADLWTYSVVLGWVLLYATRTEHGSV